MNIEPVGPIGVTVPPPEPQPELESTPVAEGTPTPESVPLPPYQGVTVDETA